MSALNSFKILSVKNNQVDVEVTMIHPDERSMNTSANFALQIILELYEKIKLGHIYNDAAWQYFPYTQDEASALIKPEFVSKLDEILTAMRWKEIDVTEEDYNYINVSGIYEYKGQKLSGTGMTNGRYYVSLETEFDTFCEKADRKIELVEELSIANYPHWYDSIDAAIKYGNGFEITDALHKEYSHVPNPSYVLRITVNPDFQFLLNHVAPGCFWDSAAYDFLPYCSYYYSFKKPILNTLTYTPIVEPAADAELQEWWAGLSEDWRIAFLINLDFQRRFIYPQMTNKYCGMMLYSTFERLEGNDKLNELRAYQPTIEELRLISQLSIMVVSGMNVGDLEPLRMLKGLRILDSEDNQIEDLKAILEATSLEFLVLVTFHKPKPDHTVLRNLTKLKELIFDPCTQEELDMIEGFQGLRKASLTCKFEADLTVLTKLKNLKRVSGSDREPFSEAKKAIIEQLRNNGVEINWDHAPKNGEFGSY